MDGDFEDYELESRRAAEEEYWEHKLKIQQEDEVLYDTKKVGSNTDEFLDGHIEE